METLLYLSELDNVYYDLSLSLSYFYTTSLFKDYIFLLKKRDWWILWGSDCKKDEYYNLLKITKNYLKEAELSYEKKKSIMSLKFKEKIYEFSK